ncbi:MAG: hypothetical protein ACLQU3_23170 [Limisphaerales bacterium]
MHSTASFLRALALGGVFTAGSLSVLAQDDNQSEWNHFGLDFRMGFNIQAKFMNSGAAAAPPPPSAGGAVNRAYNDGFVNVDSSGNAGNLTWNWAYQHPSQVVGDTLQMHSASVSGGSQNDDPNLGFEVSYVRDLGHESWGRWGLKAAFGYTEMDSSTGVQAITDTYQLNGVMPPIAPYAGSFSGPGVVIGSIPARSIEPGNWSLDATLYDFRLGPTVDLDITKRLSVELGGGLVVGVVDSTFAFNETTSSGSSSSTGYQVGGYAEAGLAYRVCSAASLFGGVQFQSLGDFNQSVGGRRAQLDLSQSIFCVLGFEFHF